ncbi:histidine phosphatase family protein [Orbaceae bacterium ESL0727]|nr:histidine phosphatase family protein [Orbaceae bacterium ESL0727]
MKDLNLYLIRHGQTEWNITNRMQGSQNSPLTQEGILGAKITGRYLQDVPFIQAYSSPQQRARETRNYIIDENKLTQNHITIPTAELADLCEMDFGTWEGRYVDDIKKDDPTMADFLTNPAQFNALSNHGEDYPTVLVRMQRALDTIVQNAPHDKGDILVVSHGTVLRLLLCVLNGGDWHKHRDNSYFPRMLNTSVSVVNYQQSDKQHPGKFTVKSFNQVDHLSD